MLCERCQGVEFQLLCDLSPVQQELLRGPTFDYPSGMDVDLELDYFYVLHHKITDLIYSVDSGCHLCAVILTAVWNPPSF